ncbi:ribulose-5-phosphate 4-epimerase/fuculose-1-phosphate aldolase [Novosphingobium capsulatum]|uniref:Ribulose-5-phosphate 4-epimerase/fuculose-1-phosphate aldolase n=1 Tax=Novosphingobium capsulatum TaxID=13688 RepID=A0ABU1ML37_9SPHN|nr:MULTISPECIES: class II aldolase/adducin family protein [Novosphingobium]MBB3358262.1 ribulose-5-phosphate 4-epimerase/fuculose-1-phosphate aldolase [Novosphingobium sp. BK256]MBB3374623.1 ribulose-5-phosphate 4-epimerase/fuculose-1-phosphate aldolase [Novosphingobium sp. BK280]MBB3379035.1 ribulose-5-phosphate 4-epimerase/fuculose-1-phosphate aldolase [Novosphingobium sp. BK258]MBB3420729.1 ribulose-5-phosphate 4-epimerase/fuculose-1-phosphate aldolase [Novosphingobium sp. BK267]MBB3448149.
MDTLAPADRTTAQTDTASQEWQIRVELAALYRLVALHGWDDAIYTHISARLPGDDHHFLINPYGMFFEEITASSLVKIDLDGKIIEPTPYKVNPAGFTIHSAIHGAREDARFVMHLHSDHGVAVSTHSEGLLPLTQHALIALPSISYHGYEGIALNLEERERIVADLGDKKTMILRNHGTLAVGETAAEAWLGMYYLEKACAQQVAALSIGRDKVMLAPAAAQEEVRQQVSTGRAKSAMLAWPGFLRQLDRRLPGYDS